VPPQGAGRSKFGEREIQNRFIVDDLFFVYFVIYYSIDTIEKRGRRQLHGIANDDRLPAASNGAKRFLGTHLRSLIYDHEIEFETGWLQELSYRERRHHEARLHLRNRETCSGEKFTDWYVALLLSNFVV
jgi:hypothetical protein